MFEQTIAKWGNSLAIRIPSTLIKKLNLKEGISVEIDSFEGNIIIKPKRRNKYTLDELLEGMTANHFHGEIETGEPVGNEIW
ncbi:MAG TPA: AbrB/MazE/SpoVT family DNA-binding domain-containing protein [Cyanobacteria bacterium UBA11162]|nr:AbrB/MazE/SpoVT family DNA-binding domain-containing protein [Cyanobacteria bacterium UBA11162]